jgi:hypothetical protein
MASITINIPDEKYDTLKPIILDVLNYPTEVDDGEGNMIPNPVTENQFIKIAFLENDKKFLRQIKNLHRNKQVAIAGDNDFDLS